MSDTPVVRRGRHTKIVATLGPASATREKIEALFLAGVDTFRLNFSHGAHEEHAARFEAIRAVEAKYNRPIAVLADMQGPKLRIGTFAQGSVELSPGQWFRFDRRDEPGDSSRVPLPHPEVFEALSMGHEMLLDDGKIRVRVVEKGADYLDTEVVYGGKLSDRKGFNIPGVVLPISPLTDKDREDMAFALDLGVDYLALSFVQRPEDVTEARRLVQGRAQLVVKMEKPSALEHLGDLIELTDAVMVARGDLGVEMPPEDVPVLQRRILRESRAAGKPVIVATQMLESMTEAATPTRAEASDVATAVYDGADAVMLSAESASGQFPVEAAQVMERIARRVQRDPLYTQNLRYGWQASYGNAADAITAGARQVAHDIGAVAIATYTTSGSTTLRAARERPTVPILGLTANINTARRMALVWGVHAVHSGDCADFHDMADKAATVAYEADIADAGERLVITAGVPFGTPGATNVLHIAWVEAS